MSKLKDATLAAFRPNKRHVKRWKEERREGNAKIRTSHLFYLRRGMYDWGGGKISGYTEVVWIFLFFFPSHSVM